MTQLRASHVGGEKEMDTSGVQVMAGSGLSPRKTRHEEEEMSPVVSIMQPILRFLQLLCENHNRDLQVGQLLIILIGCFNWHSSGMWNWGWISWLSTLRLFGNTDFSQGVFCYLSCTLFCTQTHWREMLSSAVKLIMEEILIFNNIRNILWS